MDKRHIRVIQAALILLVVMQAGLTGARAQELNCIVSINISSLSGSEYTFLRDLEEGIEEYLNERTWTDHRYLDYERIDCTLDIFFEEAPTLTSFQARLIVSTRRPIYGASQFSTVVQINDPAWQFAYAQGQNLVYDPERYDPLTSTLDFYANVILGYDYDTFSELGGSLYWERARRITDRAKAQGAPGWEDLGGNRGRTDLIEQILDPRFRSLRRAYFNYHFGTLDHFLTETEAAQRRCLETIQSLETLYEEVSRQYVLDLFFNTKADELAAIFEGSNLSSQAYDMLSRVDPANLSKYDRLTQ